MAFIQTNNKKNKKVNKRWDITQKNLNNFSEKHLFHSISLAIFLLLLALEAWPKEFIKINSFFCYVFLTWVLYYAILGAYEFQKIVYNLRKLNAFILIGIILFFSIITWLRFFIIIPNISDLGIIFFIIALFIFPAFIFVRTILNFITISELRFFTVFVFDVCIAVYSLMVLGIYNIVNDGTVTEFTRYSMIESLVKIIEYGANVVSNGSMSGIKDTSKSIQSLIWTLGVFIASHVVTPLASEKKN